MKKYILPILSTFIVVCGVSAVTFDMTSQEFIQLMGNKDSGMLGSTVTTISGTDLQSAFPAVYNSDLSNLNADKLEHSDLSGGVGITYSSGAITFDCSEVIGTGMTCATEAITLDATGDWTGTFDGAEGSAYLTVATYLASTTNSSLTSIPSLATIGTIGTGVWNGTAIDFSTYTNATASNGLTISGDDIQPTAGYEIPLTASTTLRDLDDPTFTLASTTLDSWGGASATSTVELGVSINNEEWRTAYCYTTGGTADIRCGDGTTYSNLFSITTATSSNAMAYSFFEGDKRECEIGNRASFEKITCTIKQIWK